LEAVQLALDQGGDVHEQDADGSTALHGAAIRGVNSVVNLLVARGARLDAEDNRGRRPVDIAEDASDARSQPETAALLRRLMGRPSARW
jgi:ankyrin repeat protein